jgi:carbonic anhydrase/acetyltransferase-like protein (isoleucine patch superfamily)
MALYALGDLAPRIDPTAYIHPTAELIGDVVVHAHASVWPGAVLRADFNRIEVGEGAAVEDNAVVHPRGGQPTSIGRDVVVGHLAHLEGVVVEEAVLIGSRSIVMEGANVRTGAIVAGGAVVLEGVEVAAGRRAQGVPARLVETDIDPDLVRAGARTYRELAARYRDDLVRLD